MRMIEDREAALRAKKDALRELARTSCGRRSGGWRCTTRRRAFGPTW